jgi:hypothetical protein
MELVEVKREQEDLSLFRAGGRNDGGPAATTTAEGSHGPCPAITIWIPVTASWQLPTSRVGESSC